MEQWNRRQDALNTFDDNCKRGQKVIAAETKEKIQSEKRMANREFGHTPGQYFLESKV